MQGISTFIPSEQKVAYINQLLKVGFDTIDFGSFVSAKAIPQMRDTKEVLAGLELEDTETSLLAIIANSRGALEALTYPEIDFLGFPMSISETFQQRNTNKSISESLEHLVQIQDACTKYSKTLVAYISMGFGNPYGDPYDPEIVANFIDILLSLDIKIISIADTVGMAEPDDVGSLYTSLSKQFPDVELGVHLHATSDLAAAKVASAIQAGCERIDGALLGYGGCPMAKDELVGNIDTLVIRDALEQVSVHHNLNLKELEIARQLALAIFN